MRRNMCVWEVLKFLQRALAATNYNGNKNSCHGH